MQFLKEFWSSRELLGNLVLRETRGQYKRTVLGRLWSLINPLASVLIYTFIFSLVFRVQPEAGDPSGLNLFPIWLMCGLLPWGFFAGALSSTSGSLLANAGLIQKVAFPRSVLPIAAVGTLGINWSIEMSLLAVILLFAGSALIPWLPGTVLLMLLLGLFAAGLGLLLSIVTLYFRDTQYLLGILLQLWMYLTPIIYPVSLIKDLSDKVGGLLHTSVTLFDVYTVNPMYHFVQAFRQLLYDNRLPDTDHLIACTLWALAALVIGSVVFSKNEKRIAEVL